MRTSIVCATSVSQSSPLFPVVKYSVITDMGVVNAISRTSGRVSLYFGGWSASAAYPDRSTSPPKYSSIVTSTACLRSATCVEGRCVVMLGDTSANIIQRKWATARRTIPAVDAIRTSRASRPPSAFTVSASARYMAGRYVDPPATSSPRSGIVRPIPSVVRAAKDIIVAVANALDGKRHNNAKAPNGTAKPRTFKTTYSPSMRTSKGLLFVVPCV